jgi:hypothetical protein
MRVYNRDLYWYVLVALWCIFIGCLVGILPGGAMGLIPVGIVVFAFRCLVREDRELWREDAARAYGEMRSCGYKYRKHRWIREEEEE